MSQNDNKQFIINVIQEVSNIQKKRLVDTEIKGCVNYIRKLDFNLLSSLSYTEKVKRIAKSFSNVLTPQRKTSARQFP